MTTIEAVRADITTQKVDAIVNAANSGLLGGGGVDGAIHRAAGPHLYEAAKHLRETVLPDGLPTGQAVALPGFELPAKWVILAVGPDRHHGQTDPSLLASAFCTSLVEARRVGARSVAFPAISAGVYGWSAHDVAQIAVATVHQTVEQDPQAFDLVRFVLFSNDVYQVFQSALNQTNPSIASIAQ